MSFMNALQNGLEKYLSPFATKLSQIKAVQGLSEGFMVMMPITLGVSLLAILVNFPFEPLQAFMTSSGLGTTINQVLVVTMNMMALYAVVGLGYAEGKLRGVNPLICAIICLGTLMVLIPIETTQTEYSTVSRIDPSYMGSNGIFLSIIIGILIPMIFGFLMKHVSIKLPDSVPPMVTDSLSPVVAAIIIFTCAGLMKWGFSLTPYGNVFDFVAQVISAPIVNLGGSPFAYAVVLTFMQLLWFFGIHPSVVESVYMPVLMVVLTQNFEAFMAGNPMPNLLFAIMFLIKNADSLALGIVTLFMKSERFKTLGRLAIVPSICNITEPLMFGLPIVLNPIMFIPFVLAKPLTCIIATAGVSLGLANAFNPAISTPWVMPQPITAFLSGGFGLLVINLAAVAASVALFYVFFRIADKQALKEEACEC